MINKKIQSVSSGDESTARSGRSKKKVLETTLQLLTEAGLSGVSIDEVSKRSGVAKTTIYRHWPSRAALLIDACATLGNKPRALDTGNFAADLHVLLTQMAGQLGARWSNVLPSIIDAAERDKDIAHLHLRLHKQFLEALEIVVERAQKRGELPPTSKSSYLVAMIAGALFYRRWFSRESIDERFIKGCHQTSEWHGAMNRKL